MSFLQSSLLEVGDTLDTHWCVVYISSKNNTKNVSLMCQFISVVYVDFFLLNRLEYSKFEITQCSSESNSRIEEY